MDVWPGSVFHNIPSPEETTTTCDDVTAMNDVTSSDDIENQPTATMKNKNFRNIIKRDIPEWLSVSIGVFFVGALFALTTSQVYKGAMSKRLQQFNIVSNKDGGDASADVSVKTVVSSSDVLGPSSQRLDNDVSGSSNVPQNTAPDLKSISDLTQNTATVTSDIAPHTAVTSSDKAEVPSSSSTTYDNFRLPRDVTPLSYILYLRVGVHKKSLRGLVSIDVMCRKNTSKVVIHTSYHNITLKRVKSLNEDEEVGIVDEDYNVDKEMLILTVEQHLVSGRKYNLFFVFSAVLDYPFANGIHLSKYKDGDGNSREMVSTDLEPTRARKVCPCFDEPDMKATWRIIALPQDEGFSVASNMPVERINKLDDGRKEFVFQESKQMSSYLVSILVSEYDYKYTYSPQYKIKVGIHAPKGRLVETEWAFEYACAAVDYFTQKLGVPYMLPKLDMYPAPKYSALAAETWGNIVFSEEYFLLNPNTSSNRQRHLLAEGVSHEIAHQWFGDLVTMKWWNDLWLKESLATYLAGLVEASLNPAAWSMPEYMFKKVLYALAFDDSKYTHPIALAKVQSTGDIQNAYSSLTYAKGAAVVNQLAQYLGHESLFAGFKAYLEKFKYANANVAELWESVSQHSDSVPVDRFMTSWIEHPGFPIITIRHSNSRLHVSQNRFQHKGMDDLDDNDDDAIALLWYVPLSVTCIGEKKVLKNLMKIRQTSFQVVDDDDNCFNTHGYKVNVGASGLYHVNYDEDNWHHLVHLFTTAHHKLSPVDRANVLNDAYAVTVSNNHPDITLPLEFTIYLHQEDHPLPWENGMKILDRIRNVFDNAFELKNCIEMYTNELMLPVLNRMNLVRRHTHAQLTLVSNLLSYAEEFQLHPFSEIMEHLFLKWVLSKGEVHLAANTRRIILCVGVRRGNEHSFNKVREIRDHVTTAEEKNELGRALTCTQSETLLKELAQEAVAKMDLAMLTGVCNNRKGKRIGRDIVKKQWPVLLANGKDDMKDDMKEVIRACLGGSTVDELEDSRTILKTFQLGRFRLDLLRVVESLERNVYFAKVHGVSIRNWFKENYPKCYTNTGGKVNTLGNIFPTINKMLSP